MRKPLTPLSSQNRMTLAISSRAAEDAELVVCAGANAGAGIRLRRCVASENWLIWIRASSARWPLSTRKLDPLVAVVACLCDETYATEAAVVGGPGDANFTAEELADLRAAVRELARSRHRDWSPLVAAISIRVSNCSGTLPAIAKSALIHLRAGLNGHLGCQTSIL